ncbi:MAG: hypothetical protein ABWY05_11035 [Noviherbaspirillum sp.]
MSTITFPHAAAHGDSTSYAENVGRAFRSLLAALLAVKPQESVSPRAKLRSQLAVFRLAKQYESLSPNLAAELRFIASRG